MCHSFFATGSINGLGATVRATHLLDAMWFQRVVAFSPRYFLFIVTILIIIMIVFI